MLEMKLEISSKNGLHTLYSYYFLLSDNKTFYQKYPQNIFLVDFFLSRLYCRRNLLVVS